MNEKQHTRRKTKPTGPTSERGKAALSDTEQKHILYRGATVSDLEIIFAMDRRTIIARITDCQPCGKRGQADIFRIRDVAPYLVKPAGDLAEFARKARPQDMPPNTLKEFWNGQRARQAFLVEEGQLWRIEKIVEIVGEAFKSLRGTLLLIPDELALKTSLSETQRFEIQQILDAALEKLRANLVDKFGGAAQPGHAPGSYEPEPEPEADDFWGETEEGEETDQADSDFWDDGGNL